MVKKLFRLIGAHVSMVGGLDRAVERAAELGCNCMQIFSGSPRSWARQLPSTVEINKLFSKQRKLGVKSIFTHALYLINLTSDNPELKQKSIQSLVHELQFDSLIKGAGVVVHLGSHTGRGWGAVKDDLLELLGDILDRTPIDSTLLIENSAGQKGKIGSDLAEIAWLISSLNSSRVGWCLDSCHAFAAGLPLVVDSGLVDADHPDLISLIQANHLDNSLRCIHLNDSKVVFGAGNDRHDNILEGHIPEADLRSFVNHKLLTHLPLITEVPGFDGGGPDLANIKRIKDLVD